MKGILFGIGYIGYLIIGFIQLMALYSFFHDWWDWWAIFAGFASVALAYIPLVGSILGVYSAVKVWDWEIWQAILLFFWPTLLLIAISGAGFFLEFIANLLYQKDRYLYQRELKKAQSQEKNIIEVESTPTPAEEIKNVEIVSNMATEIEKVEITTIKEPTQDTEENKKSFLTKLRHGDYSLAKTFWLYSLLVFFALGVLGSLITNHISGLARIMGAKELMTVWLVLVILSFIYGINAYLGIWRAATKYTGFIVWKYLAKAIVCFWWVTSTFSVIGFVDTYLGVITK